MNERIRELAKSVQCERHWTEEDIEKFAELIVRDIIGIVEGYCETSPEIYGLPLEILEHFDMELAKE